MSTTYQIVVCGSIVPDPLQILGFHAKTVLLCALAALREQGIRRNP